MSSSQRQLSFLMISLGTSFSLGNLWRFPFVVSENGGGTFVFLYLFLGFLVGLPILILEMFLSSDMQKGQIKKIVRVVPLILTFFVLSYYSVISGWVLFFITDFLMLMMNTLKSPQSLYLLFQKPWLQWLLSSVHIIAVVYLWKKQKESLLWRFRLVLLPLITIILSLLLYQSLQLSSITDSLRYLFYPDFEKWSRNSIGHAIGHVFFTLSVGFGVFLTIREFYDDRDHVPSAALRMTILDFSFSLISLMVVFPIIFLQREKALSNPFLLFDFLPPSFLTFKYGLLFGFLFFLLLYLSALNSSLVLFRALINLASPIWTAVLKGKEIDPQGGIASLAGIFLFIVSSFPAMGFPFSFFVSVNNFSLIEKMDHFLIHLFLPASVLCLLLSNRKRIQSAEFREFILSKGSVTAEAFYVPLKTILLYIVPFLILLGFTLRMFH